MIRPVPIREYAAFIGRFGAGKYVPFIKDRDEARDTPTHGDGTLVATRKGRE
jgi:hypothetical protein